MRREDHCSTVQHCFPQATAEGCIFHTAVIAIPRPTVFPCSLINILSISFFVTPNILNKGKSEILFCLLLMKIGLIFWKVPVPCLTPFKYSKTELPLGKQKSDRVQLEIPNWILRRGWRHYEPWTNAVRRVFWTPLVLRRPACPLKLNNWRGLLAGTTNSWFQQQQQQTSIMPQRAVSLERN